MSAILSPVKELEYLHPDETGVSIPSDSETLAQDPSFYVVVIMKLGGLYESHCYDCLQKEEEEEEILLLPMEGKVSEIPTADYPPVSAVSFFRKIYSDVFEAGGYKW